MGIAKGGFPDFHKFLVGVVNRPCDVLLPDILPTPLVEFLCYLPALPWIPFHYSGPVTGKVRNWRCQLAKDGNGFHGADTLPEPVGFTDVIHRQRGFGLGDYSRHWPMIETSVVTVRVVDLLMKLILNDVALMAILAITSGSEKLAFTT